jgi:S1-C subfamily serine protease
MGEKVYHCGHPAREGWHISEGLLTGTHNDTLMVNTFAWPGSSGSVLFDETGRVLGILSAIRVGAPFGLPSLIEHITLASNIKTLDQETLRTVLRDAKGT